jgi:NAD(P)-dependent dehydrogenase (short-subunit alcohol dehydrogenase family)
MTMLAQGNVAIVTGGANGIGKGIAQCFAREGARVVVADRREEDGRTVCEQLRRNGAETLFVKMDLQSEADLDRTVQQTLERFGRIDSLVNNAGTTFKKSIEELTATEFDRLISSDLKGMFLLTRKVIPAMKTIGGGSIVHISSVHSFRTEGGFSLYAGIKGGMVSATRAMAQELGPYGIRVNVVLPGLTRNKGMEEKLAKLAPEERMERLKPPGSNFPLGRIGEPEDVGNAVVFLSSFMASYITGTSLIVDGGQTLHL